MSGIVKLGNDVIMFGSSDCPACIAQIQILNKYFKNSPPTFITYYNIKKYQAPDIIMDKNKNYSIPSWYIPTNNGSGKLQLGVISSPETFNLLVKSERGKKQKFGKIKVSDIGNWAKFKGTFPDGKGINIPNSFINEIDQTWGGGVYSLRSGTVGRELGPKNTNKIFNTNYVNDIRMANPGGPLESAVSLNRKKQILNCKNNKTPGLVTGSKNPQIVGMNGFGGLSLGPAYKYKFIPANFYEGGLSYSTKRPSKINNDTFISKVKTYKPNLKLMKI